MTGGCCACAASGHVGWVEPLRDPTLPYGTMLGLAHSPSKDGRKRPDERSTQSTELDEVASHHPVTASARASSARAPPERTGQETLTSSGFSGRVRPEKP